MHGVLAVPPLPRVWHGRQSPASLRVRFTTLTSVLPVDHLRGTLQHRNHGTNPVVQEEARLSTRNCVQWNKRLRMHLPRRHQESTPAYEVRDQEPEPSYASVFIYVHGSFQWTMRILGFIALGLLVPQNLVRCGCRAPFVSSRVIDTGVPDGHEATPGIQGPGPVDQPLILQETGVLGLCCFSRHQRSCVVCCSWLYSWEREVAVSSHPGLISSIGLDVHHRQCRQCECGRRYQLLI